MDLDARLVKRYHSLVKSHIKAADVLSTGVKSTLADSEAFNQTQAAWRFFNNERCTLTELVKPIIRSAMKQAEQSCQHYALVAHDWSGLAYKTHVSKADRFGIHHERELGYELQASLLLSDEQGGPIAPVAVNVMTDHDVFSSYREQGDRSETHLEELATRVKALEQMGFQKPLVHIVDREGDCVQWLRAVPNCRWLIRARSNSCVEHEGISLRVDQLAKQLTFVQCREIHYQGRHAYQSLASTEVCISRASRPKRHVNGKRVKRAGDAVACRLIVSQVHDRYGKVLAWWYLLSNVDDVDMATIALWYYWRWSIETFFKLLKSAGMQLELWQQETGKAIARRLLIACMACVFVWQIAEAKGAPAGELRQLLVRLSGRQMKYGVAFTRPALFAGLCSLLNTLELLNHYDVEELKQLIRDTLGDTLV
jgi:hypothetical protein